MCNTLGQTHIKALGNLADLSLFAADSSGKDAKPLGELWRSTKQLYPLYTVAHAQERLLTRAGTGRLPPARGLCGSRHGPCGKDSPWMFPNNLENTHRACPPPIGWHRHPAGTFVTFPMAMHQGRASPAWQGEMAPRKPTGVLGGGEQGSAGVIRLL